MNLKVSELLNGNASAADFLVVPNGKIAIITEMVGSTSVTENTVAKLVWDYDSGNEQVLWTVEGNGMLPRHMCVQGDGVKKLAIEVENPPGGPRWMSGSARVEVQK